jgi:hypothetical protein
MYGRGVFRMSLLVHPRLCGAAYLNHVYKPVLVWSVSLWPRSAALLLTRTLPLPRVLLARRYVQPVLLSSVSCRAAGNGTWWQLLVETFCVVQSSARPCVAL